MRRFRCGGVAASLSGFVVLLIASGCEKPPQVAKAPEPPPVLQRKPDPPPQPPLPPPAPPPKPVPAEVIAKFLAYPTKEIHDSHLEELADLEEGLEALDRLDLTYSAVTEKGLKLLPKFTGVKTLVLVGIHPTSAALTEIGHMSWLEHLNLSGCRLADCSYLSELVNLQSLNLSNTGIADQAFHAFEKLVHLESIDVSQNPLDGSGFAVFEQMGSQNPLKRIEAAKTRFGEWGFKYVKNWEQLESLNVAESGVSDKALQFGLTGMPNLRELKVPQNSISDVGVRQIGLLKGLERIDLKGCVNVTDRGISFFKAHKKLKHINIIGTTCSAASVAFLKKECPEIEVETAGGKF